jgi:plasmid stabilization system protein ParE
MKIVIREQVDADLDRIFEWIAKDSPRAATEVIRRIRQRIGRLATPGLEHMGRPGLDPAHASWSSRHTSSFTKCTKRERKSKCSTSCTAREIAKAKTDNNRRRSIRLAAPAFNAAPVHDVTRSSHSNIERMLHQQDEPSACHQMRGRINDGLYSTNLHEGGRSEILADYLLSQWGTIRTARIPINHQGLLCDPG